MSFRPSDLFLGTALLCITAAAGGCFNPAKSAVYAQVPGSNHPIATKAPSDGEYTLYRVTHFNRLGQPLDARALVTYHLPRGEPVGFRWVAMRSEAWHPNASLKLQAFAGDHEDDLGPITSITEKYYWANPAGWSHYWSMEPAFGFERRVTLQN